MADNQGDQNWRSQSFRQNVRGKIEEAIRQSGNPTTKSAVEMENHVFQKARTKEEYLGYVARLIIHVREMNSKKTVQPGLIAGQPAPTSAMVPSSGGPAATGQVSDPMSALRNLASQGGNAALTIQSQPGQTQMTASLLGSGGTISTIPISQAQQVQGEIAPSSSPNVVVNPLSQQRINPHVMPQPRFLGSVSSIVPPPQQRPPMLAPNVQLQLKIRQQQPPQQQPPGVPNTSMGGFSDSLSFVQSQQSSPASSQFPSSQQFPGHSPASVSVASQGPNSNQSTIPSPAGQPPTSVSSQMAPSPAGYAPSPTSQIAPSPVSNFSASNTTPSPASQATLDDQVYHEKLKQLSRYIEPLKRMIARIDKDEDRKKELGRMKSLLDVLTGPKRCTMDILLKCEQVLEKMEQLKMKPIDALPSANSQLLPPTKPQELNICYPLIEAITNHMKSPLFNHTLQRTFGPTVSALCGPSRRIPSPPPKRKKVDEETPEISNILQGEIARLDQRFKVQLDPVQHHGSHTVHLICQLDDKNLPCVPPINITVPDDYPDKPPQCNTSRQEYESSSFLQKIKKLLSSRLNSMPEKFSVTSLLDTWEMSVRQACAPKAIVGAS